MANVSANESRADPASAQAAQILLQSFELPVFPAEAGSLRELILTCDIKTDEYGDYLKNTFQGQVQLPRNIKSLRLELFSLGYPVGFLTALAKALPFVQELVVYSQLLGGTTAETQEDAIQSLQSWKELRSLHLLDVFAQPHFFQMIGESLALRKKGLMFLELSYTYRHEDDEFLARIPASELPLLISPSLLTCAFNIAAPEETNDAQDLSSPAAGEDAFETGKQGIMAFNRTLTPDLLKSLEETSAPTGLKMLNCTLYTLDLSQLKGVLQYHRSLVVLNATVHCEPNQEWKAELLEILSICPDLEIVEIVGNPSLEYAMLMSNPKRRYEVMSTSVPSKADMVALNKSCSKLKEFSASILRTSSIAWRKPHDAWQGGIQDSEFKSLPAVTATMSETLTSTQA